MNDTVVMLISVAANIATAVAVILTILELVRNSKQNHQEKQHKKRKDTLDAYNRLQEEVFDRLYTEYSKPRIAEIAADYNNEENKRDYRVLTLMLARIEHFCVGIEEDIYDWETVYELAHGFFDGTVRAWLMPLIERKQNFMGVDFYAHIKRVWDRMDARSTQTPDSDR